MTILISIISILLTIFFIVGIHEFGHFIVARLCGIKVLRFSIGFGKTLLRWYDKKGTEYVFAAIPLGGYVKMLDEREAPVPHHESHQAYNRQPLYKRIAVIIAGPLFNFIFAIFIYWGIYCIGFNAMTPRIGAVLPQSIASIAGIQPNSDITAIGNRTTQTWPQVIIALTKYLGDDTTLQITTKNPSATYHLDLSHWKMNELRPDPLESLGITPSYPGTIFHVQYSPFKALQRAFYHTWDYIYLNFLLLLKLVVGKISLLSLGGPISIFQTAGVALNNGVLPFFSFLAFLSIAIGVINILPIPGLDGGHLLIYAIEFILQRPLSEATQLLLLRFGLIFLMILFAQALSNDIMRI